MDIGDIRAMTGISNSGIRFLEEEGITHPTRDAQSGYRSYSEDDMLLINAYMGYRNAGLELAQVKEVLGATPEESARLVAENIACLREEFERKCRYAEFYARLLARAAQTGLVECCERPALAYMLFNADESPSRSARTEAEAFASDWQQCFPIVSPGIVYRLLPDGGHECCRGMVVERDDLASLGLNDEVPAERLEPLASCAHVVLAYASGTSDAEALEHVLGSVASLGLEPDLGERIVGRLLHVSELPDGQLEYRAEYWIPVSPRLA